MTLLVGGVKEVVPVLRFLAKKGLKHQGMLKEGTSLVWAFEERKDDGSYAPIVFLLSALFKEDGQCRATVVGTKEVPVYEVRCGQGSEGVEEFLKNEGVE